MSARDWNANAGGAALLLLASTSFEVGKHDLAERLAYAAFKRRGDTEADFRAALGLIGFGTGDEIDDAVEMALGWDGDIVDPDAPIPYSLVDGGDA